MSTTIFKPLISGRQAIAKIFIFAIVIASVAGCSARRGTPARTDEGVVINGVRWATRNADGLRIFVASPETLGGFYRMNSNRARDRYTLRRGSDNFRSIWHPCPPGWRLPTIPEFESLIAAGSVWTVVNGVYGRLFGTAPNQLFLPAAGQFVQIYREREVRDVNEKGYYLVDVPRLIISPEGDEIVLDAALPRMIMIFCQENIGIDLLHGFTSEGLAPRLWGSYVPSETIIPVTILPELSVRCVAVTADD